MEIVSIGSPLLWISFLVFIGLALAIDLGVVHRRAHTLATREAAIATAVWIGIALLFNLWVFYEYGGELAAEFLTAYLIEKALSVDNIFVFIMLFSYFAVPPKLQHRVLFFGIIGAVIFRGIFIIGGAILLQRFHWIMYVLGILLIYTGYKLLRDKDIELEPESNPIVKFARKLVPVSDKYNEDHFFIREGGKWIATPLFIVLIAVETTDVVFAVDSIPAVFAITQDPFIVFSSNIFAILGLRALYFLLSSVMRKFAYLQIGLAFILCFIGVKMLVSGVFKIPTWISLAVIGGMLTVAVLASLRRGLIETPLEPPNS
jgi:tellurite resistance protein TerC